MALLIARLDEDQGKPMDDNGVALASRIAAERCQSFSGSGSQYVLMIHCCCQRPNKRPNPKNPLFTST